MQVSSNRMIYFDNASTTYPKPDVVYDFMKTFYQNFGGNVGRGTHSLSMSSEKIVYETRIKIQNLLHCPTKQVIYAPSATIALNMIIQGLISLEKKNIYVSPFEHNAIMRVLYHYERLGHIKIYIMPILKDLSFDFERLSYDMEENKPEVVILSHASNVIGLITPVLEVCNIAKKFNATTIVDMAQTAGLVDLNTGSDLIDFAVFAGHKTLYGPTGLSGFVMKKNILLPPVLFGGTGYDSINPEMPDSLPQKYEMGTLNIQGIAGLYAALDWIEKKSISKLWDTEQKHRIRLLNILESFDFVKIIGNNKSQTYTGIVSCLMEGIPSDIAASVLNQKNICVRTGLQCSPLAHKYLGTYPAGTIRFSTGYFNTDEDFNNLKTMLEEIEEEI